MNIPKTANIVFVSLIVGLLVFLGITKYQTSKCQSSFGTELNTKRRELHIPILPNDWSTYSKDDHSTMWEAKKVKKGHGFKVIVYDNCELDLEEDHYYFSSKKIQDTVLTIDYKYVNSHRKNDSTVFIFQTGNHADTISKQKTDSIFRSNKISKDL